MPLQIYFLTKQENETEMTILEKLAKLHRENSVDVLFLDERRSYPSVKNYCNENRNFQIDVHKLYYQKPSDWILDINQFCMKKGYERAASVLEEEELEKLARKLTGLCRIV